MALVTFFFASWLAAALLYVIPRRLTFMENCLLFLVALVISINVSWIIIEELKLIELTREPLQYTAYLLYRSLLVPLLFVLWLNVLKLQQSIVQAVLVTAGLTGTVLLCNGLALYEGIFTYAGWNVLYDLVAVVLLQAVLYGIYRLAAKWMVSGAERV
ncbi:hypothetical protein [Paenibacillus sp. YYML68]|uniref:hypothetical protein n=1 Tax=Paenibacillus sp. YYML68 TaxID=2909250 RepID=UPI002493C35F|nr:hypothetical protein [Paenibacillus sp. YYML68]